MGKIVSFELDSVDDVVSEYQGLDAPGGNTVTVTGSVLDMLRVVELEWFDGHPVAVTVAGPWLDEEFVTSGMLVLVLIELILLLTRLQYYPTCNHRRT